MVSFQWWWVILVLFQFHFNWCLGCWENERIGLLQLKAYINYPNGNALPSWVEEETANCCQWEGVDCNSTTGRVSGLQINYTALYSPTFGWYIFNASLFLPFEDLRTLHLPGNGIADWIQNQGFDRLSRLNNLEALDLSYNDFNSSVLLSISRISSLKYLYLGGNQFEGSTHFNGFESLSKLNNLEALDLSDNYFNSSVLSSISGISSLKYLYLSGNQLEGSTHFNVTGFGKLAGLRNLEVLDLSYNQLNSSSIQSFLKFDDFLSLKELDLTYNQIESFEGITGLKGSTFWSNLEVLKLSMNHLKNSIIPSLRGLSKLKLLDLGYNRLKGSIKVKELFALSNLEELDMSENKIESFVYPQGIKTLEQLKVLHLNRVNFNTAGNLLKFLMTIPSLKTLYLEENKLEGEFTTQGWRNLRNLEYLFLGSSSLNKNFLQSIGALTSLKGLSLSNSSLNGTLPNQGWCELRNLQELDLSHNQLEGILPPCLGNLSYLRALDFSHNKLTGNIAHSPLVTLRQLEYLSLSYNYFEIPISLRLFVDHTNLKVVLLDNNSVIEESELSTWSPKFQLNFFNFSYLNMPNFTVSLPSFLHYQYDLRVVDLSNCNIKGTFPNWLLENNTRLEGLFLSNNSFVGSFYLPSDPNPSILSIDISNNKMGGRIPTNISTIFPHLENLFMSGNVFSGNIASLFHDMTSLWVVDLSDNLLSGPMPEYFFTGCPLLGALRLSKNKLSGKIFPRAFNVTRLSQLFMLDVSDNHFSGELPKWLGNMTYMRELLMSKNNFHGSIPSEFCQLNSLFFFDLSENNLSGYIPSCFNSTGITHFHLYKNRLEGPITGTFQNSSGLVTLDLRENYFSGRIPTWIGNLSELAFVLLKGNDFRGSIPTQLCQLDQLRILDISHNYLSGSLPPCLGNLFPLKAGGFSEMHIGQERSTPTCPNCTVFDKRIPEVDIIPYGAKLEIEFTTKKRYDIYKGDILLFMSGIDFSCNQFTGEIPPEFGNLSNIRALNFSHNSLTMSIPATFSNLSQIESLDLSYNNLTGQIPSQLTVLNFLAVFSVAYNNLSGTTPNQKGQFGTFDQSSYEGNPLLCGPPLGNNCYGLIGSPSLVPNASNNQEEGDYGLLDLEVFYWSFVGSYVTVLLGILLVLCINPHWRRAWFYLIEVFMKRSYYFFLDNVPKFKFRNM